ncbi:MAG: hypothetical protein R6V05_02000 [Candidatus Brocadiia bacterium]
MAEEKAEDIAEEKQEGSSDTGGLVSRLFHRKGENPEHDRSNRGEGTAHVPATVLTVEYLDDSEGMDAALREMEERLRRMEETISTMQQTQAQLIGAVNQQARDIGRVVESIGRRIDRLYRSVTGHEAGADTQARTATRMEPAAAMQAGARPAAPEVPDDPDHQNAWRVARVLAADLEAYHEEAVKEGVLYGTFYKLLREPIEKARETYEERVPDEIVDHYDYFSRALDELIARKRIELDEEEEL